MCVFSKFKAIFTLYPWGLFIFKGRLEHIQEIKKILILEYAKTLQIHGNTHANKCGSGGEGENFRAV